MGQASDQGLDYLRSWRKHWAYSRRLGDWQLLEVYSLKSTFSSRRFLDYVNTAAEAAETAVTSAGVVVAAETEVVFAACFVVDLPAASALLVSADVAASAAALVSAAAFVSVAGPLAAGVVVVVASAVVASVAVAVAAYSAVGVETAAAALAAGVVAGNLSEMAQHATSPVTFE